MNAYDDLDGKPETYEQALARSEACLNPKRSEQETAEQIAEKREAMRRHDAHFSPAFFGDEEQQMISYELARKLGYPLQWDGEE